MSEDGALDINRCAIHTITNKPWDLSTCIKKYQAAGLSAMTVWRYHFEDEGMDAVVNKIQDSELKVASVARSGFFTGDENARKNSIIDNKKAIDESASIKAPSVVLVCGATPGNSVNENLDQIVMGINEIIPYAESQNVKLAIEPLHPMYAGDKSAICSLNMANDICDRINHPMVGVAIDVYHIFWEHDLEKQIKRCGEQNRIFAFHTCDFIPNFKNKLTDRGLMGEGVAKTRQIRQWIEEAGFSGFIEVEIFSERYWAEDQNEYLKKILQAYKDFA